MLQDPSHTVEIIDHMYESHGAIGRLKWHYCVSPLDSISALECQFLLQFRGDGKLVVACGSIIQPEEECYVKRKVDSAITTRNGVSNLICDLV